LSCSSWKAVAALFAWGWQRRWWQLCGALFAAAVAAAQGGGGGSCAGRCQHLRGAVAATSAVCGCVGRRWLLVLPAVHHKPATAMSVWCQAPRLNRHVYTPLHPFGGHLTCIKGEGLNELCSSCNHNLVSFYSQHVIKHCSSSKPSAREEKRRSNNK
jgi:hypothetical protein